MFKASFKKSLSTPPIRAAGKSVKIKNSKTAPETGAVFQRQRPP